MTVFSPLESAAREPMDPWWENRDIEAARLLFDTVEALRQEQTYIESRCRKAIELYENVEIDDLNAWNFATPTEIDGPNQLNIVESIVDTIHAEIITQRTKPQFCTYGGDWMAQERAKSLGQFVGGIFYENRVHEELAPDAAWDALVFGDGWIRRYIDSEGRVKLRRVFPFDVVFDDVEAANGPPQQLYEVKLRSRQLLMKLYEGQSSKQALIKDAPEFHIKNQTRRISDMVQVIEGWHLGSAKKPGRTIIAVHNGALEEDSYAETMFPFINLKFKRRRKGFLGKGVPEILEGHQENINTLREKISTQIQSASPYTWVPPGSKISESNLSNEVMRVIESEVEPKSVAYMAVPNDLLQHYASEQAAASELVGVNMLMMKSELPPGIDGGSGRAVRIYNDIKSKRFMRFARAYETMHLELAEHIVRAIENSETEGTGYTATSEQDGTLQKIDFKEVRLPKNSFIIRPAPVNFLADTPTGQLSDIEALAQIFPDEMKPYLLQMIQSPDLQHLVSRLGSQQDAVEKILGDLMAGRTLPNDRPPIPFMKLDNAIEIAQQVILEAYAEGAPNDRIQRVIDWVSLAKELLAKVPPPPMPMAPMPGAGAPMGAPPALGQALALPQPQPMPGAV